MQFGNGQNSRATPLKLTWHLENGWLEDYFPFRTTYFQGRAASFRECICIIVALSMRKLGSLSEFWVHKKRGSSETH